MGQISAGYRILKNAKISGKSMKRWTPYSYASFLRKIVWNCSIKAHSCFLFQYVTTWPICKNWHESQSFLRTVKFLETQKCRFFTQGNQHAHTISTPNPQVRSSSRQSSPPVSTDCRVLLTHCQNLTMIFGQCKKQNLVSTGIGNNFIRFHKVSATHWSNLVVTVSCIHKTS